MNGPKPAKPNPIALNAFNLLVEMIAGTALIAVFMHAVAPDFTVRIMPNPIANQSNRPLE